MLGVVVGGLGLLVAIATVIGVTLDRDARDAAWKRIALARRHNAERARELEQRELAVRIREADLDAREAALERRERRLRGEPPDRPA